MYAIVRKDRGGFYTSVVFGFFCKPQAGGLFKKPRKNPSDYFYLVLNEDKTCLVKHYLFPQKSKRLDPRILIVEADQSDWYWTPKDKAAFRSSSPLIFLQMKWRWIQLL